jgi:hypothetical protein
MAVNVSESPPKKTLEDIGSGAVIVGVADRNSGAVASGEASA